MKYLQNELYKLKPYPLISQPFDMFDIKRVKRKAVGRSSAENSTRCYLFLQETVLTSAASMLAQYEGILWRTYCPNTLWQTWISTSGHIVEYNMFRLLQRQQTLASNNLTFKR